MKTDDGVEEVETEDGVFGTVSRHLAEQFRLSFLAPCCKPGKLFDDIGFLGDTEAASRILLGTYDFPPDTDPATRLLFEETAATYA